MGAHIEAVANWDQGDPVPDKAKQLSATERFELPTLAEAVLTLDREGFLREANVPKDAVAWRLVAVRSVDQSRQ